MLDAKANGAVAAIEMSDTSEVASAKAHLPADHPAVKPAKVGILVANLGTPDNYDYWSMRRYLNEFLSDRRVIDYSPFIWQPLLQLVILSKRPFSSGEAYKSIWNHEAGDSPLMTITKAQTTKLKASLSERYLHALRQSFNQVEGPRVDRPGLPQDPVLSALPALRRRNLCHRQ